MDLLPRVFRSEGDMVEFDPSRIMVSLMKETGLNEEEAKKITEFTVRRIISSGIKFLSGPHIREIVCSILSEQHYEQERKLYTRIGMPLMDYEDILERVPVSGEIFNPEKIHHWAANQIAKEYTLLRVLNDDESKAHLYGDIHIHDLKYFDLRPLSQIWDPRIILKNGLPPGNTGMSCCKSGPASNLKIAVDHLGKWLGLTQSEFSGNQGFNFITTFLAPYAKNLSDAEIKNEMLNLVYEINQISALTGRDIPITSIFSSPVPIDVISELPAIGVDGNIVGKYGDYNNECLKLFNSLIEVFTAGDYYGNAFTFPKHLIYYEEDWLKEFDYSNVENEIKNMGTSYLVNLSSIWLKNKVIENYEADRFVNTGVLQNICLNLPRYAYQSRDESEFIEILEDKISLSFGILNKKYDIIEKRINSKHLPLCCSLIEDRPLYRLKNQKLTLSFVGLNEAVKILADYELHENSDAFNFAKKIIQQMNKICVDKSIQEDKEYNLIENSSEKPIVRFANLDLIHFSNKVKTILNSNKVHYTNSYHFSKDASLDIMERIHKQGEFHELIQNEVIEHINLKLIDENFTGIPEFLLKLCLKSKIGGVKFET